MLCKIVSPQNDIYKLSSIPSTFQELLATIKTRCGEEKCRSTCLKYVDSENELITLNNNEDYMTAIQSCEIEQLKTLKVFVIPEGKMKLSIASQKPESLDGTSLKSATKPLDARKGNKDHTPIPQGSGKATLKHECGECHQEIHKVKYTCLQCHNYQCCQGCEARTEHRHPLLKIRLPDTAQLNAIPNLNTNFNLDNTPKKGEKRADRVLLLQNHLQKASAKILYSSKLCFDKRLEPASTVEPCQQYPVTMVVKNTGKDTWPEDTRLRCVNGTYINKEIKVPALEPGSKQAVSLTLETPSLPGKHLSQWMLSYNDEGKPRSFGQNLFLELFVGGGSEDMSTKDGFGGKLFHQSSVRLEEQRKGMIQKEFIFRSNSAYYSNEGFSGKVGVEKDRRYVCNFDQGNQGCRPEEGLIRPTKQFPVTLS